jgi:predicted AAA+ superfamily ATPase
LKYIPYAAYWGLGRVEKTTLAKGYGSSCNNPLFFDLENPVHLLRLEDPTLAPANLKNDLVVIDEVQRRPELFPILRVLVDERPRKF